MNPIFFIALIGVVLTGSASVAAADNVTDEGLDLEAADEIDRNTYIIDYYYSDGRVFIEFYSDRPQQVTLADAGGFWQDGPVNTDTVRLLPDRTQTVEIAVTEVDGFVGVSIETSETLYGLPIEQPTEPLLPGEPQRSDPLIAAGTVFGLFVIGFPAAYIAVRRVIGGVRREW